MLDNYEQQAYLGLFTAHLIKRGVIVNVPHNRLKEAAITFIEGVIPHFDIKAMAIEGRKSFNKHTEEEANAAIKRASISRN